MHGRKNQLVIFIIGFVLVGVLYASEQTPSTGGEAEKTAKAMELSKPGPEHERLESLEGTWSQEVRVWPQPRAEPMEFEGSCTCTLTLGGRFLEMRGVSGEGPMETEGLVILGFDRRYERYTAVMHDSWGTYYLEAAGKYVDSTDKIVMQGEDYDPVLENWQYYRFELTFLEDDKFCWEVYFTDPAHTKGADEFKMGEIVYTRVESDS